MAPLLRQGLVLLLLCVGVSVVVDGSVVTQRSTTGIVVEGTVIDATGATLPGVTVTLQQSGKSVAGTTTSDKGTFTLPNLRPGTYTLVLSLSSFKTKSQSITLTAERPRLALPPITLEIGATTETMTVQAASPVVDTKKTTTASVYGLSSAVFASDQFQAIPSPRNTEAYASIVSNTFKRTADNPLSTFAADVDTASYSNVRRFLKDGSLPPTDAVRVEELVNYFRFSYPEPSSGQPISITTEIGDCPWAPRHKLALVGIRARAIDDRRAPRRNFVLLIDVSGSMDSPDKLPLVKTGLRMFVDTLRDDDRVGIVVYAGASGVALPSTRASERAAIHAAIEELRPGGSTNGAAGIQLAYDIARANFVKAGVNRVILATDGDFNVGVTSLNQLVSLIERERESGVFLSVLGVGTGNLKDETMEMLADKGNGNYAYLDSLFEAQRVLVKEGGATLETVAKDVKFQIEFNPAAVDEWKLVGYENRVLAHEDFNDDKKDGGELGAGHTVTVLYEIVPAGEAPAGEVAAQPRVDPLRFQRTSLTAEARTGDWLTVKVRYKQPDGAVSALMTAAARSSATELAHLPLAAAVAEFGLLLRDTQAPADRWNALSTRVHALLAGRDRPASGDFSEMVDLARALRRK